MASSAVQAAAPSAGGGGSGAESKSVVTLSEGGLRTILLNRPKALNALNAEMVALISDALDEFTRSSNCSIIALRGEGRGLCSGGDVLDVVNAAAGETLEERNKSLEFFKHEFGLDYRIANLGEATNVGSAGTGGRDAEKALGGLPTSPKIFISFMDGITMGGGVGLSVHAPFRISTERTMFAMPETGIGYWPDVGVTRSLARLDGKVGQYLGMTGARITGEEAYLTGLATHFIPSSRIPDVLDRLSHLPPESSRDAASVASALDEFGSDPFGSDNPKGPQIAAQSAFLGDRRIALDSVFGLAKVEDIMQALEELEGADAENSPAGKAVAKLGGKVTDGVKEWAKSTRSTLLLKSPRSLKVTHQSIIKARQYDVLDAFKADMRIATVFCDLELGNDFHTGVLHTLTKDPETGKRREGVAPWEPKTLQEVDDKSVQTLFFGPLDAARAGGLKMSVPDLGLESASQDQKAKAKALKGRGPLNWEPTHNVFALPSEAEMAALVDGSHPASGSFKAEPQEVVDTLLRVKGENRPGLEGKVREWLDREAKRVAASSKGKK